MFVIEDAILSKLSKTSQFFPGLNEGDKIQFNTTCDCTSTFKAALPTQLDSRRTSKAHFTAYSSVKSEPTSCKRPENNVIMWPSFECSVPPHPKWKFLQHEK
ncbi:hypothetical protein V6N13_008164 [Hibiscus sabdariffa]